MSKLKILYTIPNFKTAGSQYVLLSLFRNIDRAIFDPYICIEKFPETVPTDVLENQLIVFQWTGKKVADVMRFRTVLRKNKIDILHSWDYKSNYLEALGCRMAGVKYLYTKKNNAWSNKWKLKSFLSTHIAYDNPTMKDRFFYQRFFRDKISFIPHGVDTEVFKPLKAIDHVNFNLVCIANIGSNKNQLFILEALKQLPKNVVFYLFGREEEEYRKRLDKYVSENNLDSRVFFNGYVTNKEIPQVLKEMDVFVLPSFNEGFPVSILEALACGLPVLSSNSGGGAEYILKKGGGFIFDLDDTTNFRDYVNRLLTDQSERKSLSLNATENVKNNFSLQQEINAYEKLYLKLEKG